MSHVFISFLGTNDYLPCTYYHNEQECTNIRFVQEATLSIFCRDWEKDDKILIFTTAEAFQKNWKDNGHEDNKTKEKLERKGLKRCIEDKSLQSRINRVKIPEGKSEEEIWQIFEIVYEQLNTGDHVVFDITHAFRSIPMLAIVILNYAKVMKNVVIDGIYYGAFEVLGAISEAREMARDTRRVPILNLTPLVQLMEWSIAIDRFIGSGDAKLVGKLADESVSQILSETEGKDEIAKTIRKIAQNVHYFSKAITACRGQDIVPATDALKRNINQLESFEIVKPFKPLFERVKDQTKRFSGDVVLDGIQSARWCCEHNLIQQAFTILQETIKTWFLLQTNGELQDIHQREAVNKAVYIFLSKAPEAEWRIESPSEKNLITALLSFLQDKKELARIFRDLSNYRNDLNHAGYNKNPMSADKFKDKLQQAIERLAILIK